MGGYAYSGTRGGRVMLSLAFSEGWLYFIDGYYSSYFGGATTWVKIDEDDNGLKGSYETSHWSGSFDATSCGAWDEHVYDDTADWDSW